MTLGRASLVVLVIGSMVFAAFPALACEKAGANTHVGKITAMDPAAQRLTILDRQMSMPVTFVVAPDTLKGLSVGQVVAVKYAEGQGQLTAREILPQ